MRDSGGKIVTIDNINKTRNETKLNNIPFKWTSHLFTNKCRVKRESKPHNKIIIIKNKIIIIRHMLSLYIKIVVIFFFLIFHLIFLKWWQKIEQMKE